MKLHPDAPTLTRAAADSDRFAGQRLTRIVPVAPFAPIGRPASAMWWLHPVVCVAGAGAVYASFIGFEFTRVVPRAYIPGWHYAWGAALLLALAVGITTTTLGRSAPTTRPVAALDVPGWAMALLLAATVLAYALWFAPLLASPQLLLDLVQGERSSVRDVAATMPGITTMTQFGVAYAVACAALRAGAARPLALWERIGLAVVFALAVFRALVWSERLAVIELVLTYGVAHLAFTRVRSPRAWTIGTLAPLGAPLLLYLGFTGTEYFRSWEFFRNEYSSVWAFSFERLMAYYATASNNGIGLLVENRHWPEYSGRFVAEWLYLMPVAGDALRASVGDVQLQYSQFLEQFARPEFNNPSGLFPIVFDIGYAGSMLYFVAVGALVGQLFDGWRRQSRAGVLFYPVAVLFMVELLRFNYFASTRFFPVALALAFVWAASRTTAPAIVAAHPSAARW
jgi:hypothetical protein